MASFCQNRKLASGERIGRVLDWGGRRTVVSDRLQSRSMASVGND